MSDAEEAFQARLDELVPKVRETGEAALADELRSVRLVFADWLDEHGRPVDALGQRWLAARGKWPTFSRVSDTWDWWCEEGADDDWRLDKSIRPFAPEESLLPGPLFRLVRLTRGNGARRTSWKGAESRRKAERRLATALARSKPTED
jgi:uncharacterized protein (TIGR02996 family)